VGQLCGRTPSCPGTPQQAAARDLEMQRPFFKEPTCLKRDWDGRLKIAKPICEIIFEVIQVVEYRIINPARMLSSIVSLEKHLNILL